MVLMSTRSAYSREIMQLTLEDDCQLRLHIKFIFAEIVSRLTSFFMFLKNRITCSHMLCFEIIDGDD